MTRTAAALIALALTAGSAEAQSTPTEAQAAEDGFDVVTYMRQSLGNQRYSPRVTYESFGASNDRTSLTPHWRSSVFEGRRIRQSHGPGLKIFNPLTRP